MSWFIFFVDVSARQAARLSGLEHPQAGCAYCSKETVRTNSSKSSGIIQGGAGLWTSNSKAGLQFAHARVLTQSPHANTVGVQYVLDDSHLLSTAPYTKRAEASLFVLKGFDRSFSTHEHSARFFCLLGFRSFSAS